MKLGLACATLALLSCADGRDLFRPYVLNEKERDEMVARPWPVPVFDAAIVLGCPADPDGSPSLCERCRVKTAVREYRAGHVKNLIFSGGAAHSQHVEADVMGDLAVRRAVPPEHVFREGRALTTWQNIKLSQRILQKNHFDTVLFISTSDHLARSRRIALFYGIDDHKTGYKACDLDEPHDSEAEWQKPWPAPKEE